MAILDYLLLQIILYLVLLVC